MPSLYRKKNRAGKTLPHYYCTFRIPTSDGESKQIHRSTGERTKNEAMNEAIRLEQTERAAASCDDETSSEIFAKVKEAAHLATKGMLNPAHGRRLIGEIMSLAGLNSPNHSLRSWIDDWINEKRETVKASTLAFYESTTKQFLAFMGEAADKPLDSVTTQQIREYRDSIRSSGRAAKTANQKLKCLRSIFGDAVKVAALIHNPASAIRTLKEVDSVHRLPFTHEEVAKLIENAPSDDWRGVILLGGLAGLRLTDATRLTAGNLDLERKVVQLTPAKTESHGTTVEIPLHPDLFDFFSKHEIPPFAKSPLFPSLVKLGPGSRGGLSKQFEKIMEAAGIDRCVVRTMEDGAARPTAQKSFHSLRHTFTSWLAKADVPEEIRMKMTGHTQSKVHQKYTHQEISTLRAGVERIPRISTQS